MTTVSPIRRAEETPAKTSVVFAAIAVGSCAITFSVGIVTLVWLAVKAVGHVHVTWVP